MGCRACKTRKAGNLKRRKLLAPEHAVQSQGHSFPSPVTGTNHSCLPSISAPLAAACTQQRKEFPPSHLPLAYNSEHRAALSWQMGKVHAGYSDIFSGVHCRFRSWQAYPWSPMTPSNFPQQPQQLDSEQSRPQPPSDRGQAAFTCYSDHCCTPLLLKELCYMTLEFSSCNTYPG